MSIISDALKKAQNERTGTTQAPNVQSTVPRPQNTPARELSAAPKKTFALPFLLTLAVILAAAAFRFASSAHLPAIFAPAPKPVLTMKDNVAIVHNTTSPAAEEKKDSIQMPRFNIASRLPVLTGIMYSQVNPLAIINGATVKEGEEIGGAKIVKILPDRVLVIVNGQEMELTLK